MKIGNMYIDQLLSKQKTIISLILILLLFLPEIIYGQTGFSCFKLFQVSFNSLSGNIYNMRSDDDVIDYDKPHWQDNNLDGDPSGTGERKFPVCYLRGTKMAISAKFKIDPSQTFPSGFKIKIKGECTYKAFNYKLKEQDITLSGNEIEYPETEVDNVLPNTVFFDTLIIQWKISIADDPAWPDLSKSKHRIYVINKPPIAGSVLYYTCVHIGCKNAINKADDKQIVTSIYLDFKDQKVQKVDSNVDLVYWSLTNPAPQPDCWTTAGLLKYGNATCGGWADFFKVILQIQGIQSEEVEIKSINGYAVPSSLIPRISASVATLGPISNYELHPNYMFYVKNWGNVIPNKFAVDLTGAAGQGNPDPRAWFENHAVVKYDGKYYDPSYGQSSSPYSNGTKWEDNSLDGFGAVVIEKSSGNYYFWVDKKDNKGSLETIFSN